MANKRGPGDNRQEPCGKNQRTYKESTSQCSSRSNPSRRNPEEEEEPSTLWRNPEQRSCSKKTSYCQSKPLNPYLADQGPDEDEDEDEDEEEERSSTRRSYSNDAKYDSNRPMSTTYQQRPNRKLTEDRNPSQSHRNNSYPPKKKS